MTVAELEQRVVALEREVVRLAARLAPESEQPQTPQAAPSPDEGGLIPEAEYPLVLDVPPKETIRVTARIRSIKRAEPSLTLSDAEWESLGLEALEE